MKIGFALPNTGRLATKEALFTISDEAERMGFDSVWTGDHLAFPTNPSTFYPYSRGKPRPFVAKTPILDPLIVMAAIIGRTQRLHVGVSVLILPYRHPLLTAKMVSSIEALSGGRVYLGVGVGWLPEEFEALKVDFRQRGRMSDEQLKYLDELFYKNEPEFRGEFYEFSDMVMLPRPERRIPVWVGGNTKPAMRRAVRFGDGINFLDLEPDELEKAIDELKTICAEEGRAFEELELSIRATFRITESRLEDTERVLPLTGSLEQVTDDLRRFKPLGISHVIFGPRSSRDVTAHLNAMEVAMRDLRPALE